MSDRIDSVDASPDLCLCRRLGPGSLHDHDGSLHLYTSNIFAILGLRAHYFALAAILGRFAYLKYALSVLLVFIGSKIFIADALGWEKLPPEWSLGITLVILSIGVAFSLWRTGKSASARAETAIVERVSP